MRACALWYEPRVVEAHLLVMDGMAPSSRNTEVATTPTPFTPPEVPRRESSLGRSPGAKTLWQELSLGTVLSSWIRPPSSVAASLVFINIFTPPRRSHGATVRFKVAKYSVAQTPRGPRRARHRVCRKVRITEECPASSPSVRARLNWLCPVVVF